MQDGSISPETQKKSAGATATDEAEQKSLRRKQESRPRLIMRLLTGPHVPNSCNHTRHHHTERFWQKLSHVLPDMHQRVWKSLHNNLDKYWRLLHYRSTLVDDAVNLQKQNEELKHLLDQYLGSKVNEELQVPPTHVIRVVAGGQTAQQV